MTTTPEQRLTVLKHLATGKAHHVVATITHVNIKDVKEIGDSGGYPDTDALKTAAQQLQADLDAAALPVRPERAIPAGGGWARKTLPHAGDPPTRHPTISPAAGDSTPPAAGPDLKATTKAGPLDDPFPRVDDDQTARLRALINTAKAIPTRKVQRQLERALDALTTLQEYVTAHQAALHAREQAERDRLAARAEVERLEKQLLEARAKLRRHKAHPGGNGRPKVLTGRAPAASAAGGQAVTQSGQLEAARAKAMAALVTREQLDALGVTSKQVRAWAHDNNVDCPDAGRLPTRVLDAWKQAHTNQEHAS